MSKKDYPSNKRVGKDKFTNMGSILGVSNEGAEAGRAVNRRPAAQLKPGLWAR